VDVIVGASALRALEALGPVPLGGSGAAEALSGVLDTVATGSLGAIGSFDDGGGNRWSMSRNLFASRRWSAFRLPQF
jgi:hypothetical protein